MRGKAVLVVAVLTSACSSFGSDTGSPSDASTAPTGDGGTGTGSCTADVVDAFTDLSELTSNSGAVLDPNVGSGAPPSALVDMPVKSATRYMEWDVDPSACPHVVASVDLQVDLTGDGEVDFFGIYPSDDKFGALALVHDATGQTVAEAADSTQQPLGVPLPSSFTRVTLEVDFGVRTWKLSLGSANTSGAFSSWPPGLVHIRVGYPFVRNVTKPWRVHFDDLRITSGR